MPEISKTTPCTTSKQSLNVEIATALFQKLDDDTKDRVLELLEMIIASRE